MRVVVQRVTRAEVRVAGEVVGRIDQGLLLLAGFNASDDEDTLAWMAAKIPSLRIFRASDGDSSFERSLADVNGGLLVVSQFTLYGDARKGRRPSFIEAAPPAEAERLYERFIELLRAQTSGPVETGRFGTMMDVELVNDGPVTLLLER
ncbi:MAG TPA: D-aminoacyl-tRNA deacylase [Longimicrobiales bacterium]|nr:D-aminoacyl-tRNA deacylase [Longimicrobiales bacterium]